MIGDKLLTSCGEAIVLDVKEKYLILFRLDGNEFVKANNYQIRNGRVTWGHGNYYSSLSSLAESLIKEVKR